MANIGTTVAFQFKALGAKEVTTSLKNMEVGTMKLSAAIAGFQIAADIVTQTIQALIKWATEARDAFREFQYAMAEVSTILYDDAYPAIYHLTSGVEELSVSFGKSTSDLAKGLYDILSASVDASDSINLLRISTKAAVAGMSDVSTSVDVMTSILNAWGLTVEQMTTISDQLFQTVVRGKLVYEDLANAMGYIAPIAANLNVDFKEVAAALSTVTRQGQHVDMATRGLALGLQNIADLTPQASEAAEKYGVDLSYVALSVGGLQYVLEDLNKAMSEHGIEILPKMITNMRSLRVFMALAGEGLDGYIYDLDELNKAAGKTDEALAKMMNTAKIEADILEQSMAMLERSIGEAWHGLDIWYKKNQLWWGTLISGGDADKAVNDYEERIIAIRDNFDDLYTTQLDIANMQPFDQLLLSSNDFLETINSLEFGGKSLHDNLTEYMNLIDVQTGIDNTLNKLNKLKGMLREGKFGAVSYELGPLNPTEAISLDTTDLEEMKTLFKELTEAGVVFPEKFSQALETGIMPINVWKDSLQVVNNAISSNKFNLNDLEQQYGSLSEVFNWFKAGLDNLSTSISDNKQNIMTLESAISDLKYNVEDTYTAFNNMDFSGFKSWEIAVTAATTSIDRFQNFAQMAIKYGDDMNWSFMDGIQGMTGTSDALGSVSNYLNEYNEDIWKQVATNNEYEGSIKDLIKALGEQNKAYEDAKDNLKVYNDKLNDISLAISKNNFAIAQLELKGMMRRHGLTRGEQQKIKKIQIENMKERIKQMGIQTSEEYNSNKETVDNARDSYEKMMGIYDEYIDRVNFDLSRLKDARDTDLQNSIRSIDAQRENLGTYTGWYEEKLGLLETDWNTYYGFLETLSQDPKWSEFYNEIYGVNYLNDVMAAFEKWKKMIGLETGPTTTAQTITQAGIPSYLNDVDEKWGKLIGLKTGPTTTTNTTGIPSFDASDWFKRVKGKYGLGGRQRGSYYIPDTKPYLLHRGEQVIPAGREKTSSGGNVTIEPITVNMNVYDVTDTAKLAQKIQIAIQQGLISGVTTKYR